MNRFVQNARTMGVLIAGCTSVVLFGTAADAQQERQRGAEDDWIANSGIVRIESRGNWCGTDHTPVRLEDGVLAGGVPAHCGPLTSPPTTATTPNPGGDIYAPSMVKYRVPVVFHVIHSGAGEHPAGQLSVARVQSQITALNGDFLALAGTPGAPGLDVQIEFYLNTAVDGDGIVYHNNATWFTSGPNFSSIAVDPHNNLNIYSYNLPGGLLGQANIPQGCGACVPVGSASDGILIDYLVVGRPSLAAPPFHLGRTLTHEVGHYLGLYHTFQGGCSFETAPGCYQTGDAICDTPSQGSPTSGCPASANTCVGGGNDPINNYMDYSDDACMNNFTPEQARRMRCSLEHWRPLLWEAEYSCPVVPTFGGNFLSTPHTLLPDVGVTGTTIFTPGDTCPPGLTDGAGEGSNTYAGSGWLHVGNEIAYRIRHGGGSLRVNLTGLTTDLDLMLLGSAGTPASTLARSENGGTTSETVFLASAPPGIYFAVVDTFGATNNGSPFTITYIGTPVGYNLDLNATTGAGAGAPSSTFGGAANQPGTWSALTGPSDLSINLQVANGFITSASIIRSSASGGNFAFNNANTSGDHELLLDDIQDAPNGITYTFFALPAGRYRVYTYAIAPDSSTAITNIAVTGSPDGTIGVGGPMPVNGFANGITHANHRVTVAPGGTIVITGTSSSFLSINGFQIVPRPACTADTNGDDVVNVTDLLAVIGAWGTCAGCPPTVCAADTNGDCQINVTDLLAVIGAWGTCP